MPKIREPLRARCDDASSFPPVLVQHGRTRPWCARPAQKPPTLLRMIDSRLHDVFITDGFPGGTSPAAVRQHLRDLPTELATREFGRGAPKSRPRALRESVQSKKD